MNNRNIFIAGVEKILPEQYSSLYIADKFYPVEYYGQTINKLGKRLADKFQVIRRPCVLNLEEYPNILLKKEEYHPLNWGVNTINKLTTGINKSDIGFFSLSYNISFHEDTLPNLATQIAMSAGLDNLEKVEEISNYGCAASIYSIENAIAYCKEYDRPALVFTFDQCSKKGFQLDKDNADFKKMLITNLLFTDGGVGVLIIPEHMRSNYNHPLMKVKDTMTKYKMGSLIKMKDQNFIMDSNLKNVMPKLVSDVLLKPFLVQHKLTINDINEWSIHQGGSEVIKQFCKNEVLNLSQKHIKRSLDKFYEYGNVSSASCLLVLESFFNLGIKNNKNNTKGIILGFGAGYYLGTLLYEWDVKI